MRNVMIKSLPNGQVPFATVKDVTVRSVIMKLNENIMSLKRQLEETQRAVLELQGR